MRYAWYRVFLKGLLPFFFGAIFWALLAKQFLGQRQLWVIGRSWRPIAGRTSPSLTFCFFFIAAPEAVTPRFFSRFLSTWDLFRVRLVFYSLSTGLRATGFRTGLDGVFFFLVSFVFLFRRLGGARFHGGVADVDGGEISIWETASKRRRRGLFGAWRHAAARRGTGASRRGLGRVPFSCCRAGAASGPGLLVECLSVHRYGYSGLPDRADYERSVDRPAPDEAAATMVNVRCQACQAKYRLLAAKRVNLLGLVLEQAGRPKGHHHHANYQPVPTTPRFPYRPPIHKRPRSYIIPPNSSSPLVNDKTKKQKPFFFLSIRPSSSLLVLHSSCICLGCCFSWHWLDSRGLPNVEWLRPF